MSHRARGWRRYGVEVGRRYRPFQDRPRRREGWAPHPMQRVTCDNARQARGWQETSGPMHSRSGWFLEVVPPVPDSLGYANRGRLHTGPQSWTTGDAAFMEQILRHQKVMVRFA